MRSRSIPGCSGIPPLSGWTIFIYSGLVQLDPTLAPRPDLALKWEQPDSRTWEFTLRRDAKFQDGQPVTADDVAYTFTTILDPKLNARFRSLYDPIEKIEAIGPDKVRFVLKEPYAPLLSYLDLGIVPKHAVEAGRNARHQPAGQRPVPLRPLGPRQPHRAGDE